MKTNFTGSLRSIKFISVFFLFFILQQYGGAYAQCGSFITTFPYNEDFESGPAWTSGGANNDWAWGTPAHPTISCAGSGTKAWCAGGLTGSAYSASAQSWIMSPCFDFTSLNYPWISFKIFWETEFQWDGVTLQYSLNSGTTWTNVGAYNDPVNCLNDNWFNYNNISWLTSAGPKHGWSGRSGLTSGSCTGGNGSGGWVTAMHCMNTLANKPNVRFRFLFGSGTSCNNFDGVAVDNILIQDAVNPGTTGFTYACASTNTVNFTNTSTCTAGYSWNFGDPASGASNASTLTDPVHVFSGPGTYTVTLTNNSPCGAPGVFTQIITLISTNVSSTNISCAGGNDGTATANVVDGTGMETFSWNTIPVQTGQTATGLAPGTYTVTVTQPGSCLASATVVITEPTPIVLSLTSSPSCTDICNGSVDVAATGGTPPYVYAWTSLGTNQSYTGNVCAGTFTVTVTDANGCTNMNALAVDTLPSPVITVPPVTICLGAAGTLTATGASTYTWWPANGLSDTTGAVVYTTAQVTITYNVYGTSVDGCTSSASVLVDVSPIMAPVAAFSHSPQHPDVFHPQVNFINLSAGGDFYEWNFYGLGSSNEINPIHGFPVDSSGTYTVCLVVYNSVGCSNTVCQQVHVAGFTSLYVPNAFTPDGDGVNDIFLPIVRDVADKDFNFNVFNRWGEIIFTTTTVHAGWDGTQKGTPCKDGIYVWKIHFIEPGTETAHEISGHFILIR
ncbi:MAG TPA: gliding motility-associated C-terminal domain-containing protein [Flavobacteriales bacterium]|nr:gliding motility-associated C-terminal domain-containing protein [Flavobacteriales bacterium]